MCWLLRYYPHSDNIAAACQYSDNIAEISVGANGRWWGLHKPIKMDTLSLPTQRYYRSSQHIAAASTSQSQQPAPQKISHHCDHSRQRYRNSNQHSDNIAAAGKQPARRYRSSKYRGTCHTRISVRSARAAPDEMDKTRGSTMKTTTHTYTSSTMNPKPCRQEDSSRSTHARTHAQR